MASTIQQSPEREFSGGRLVVAGLTGGGLAAALNLALYFAAQAAGVSLVGQFDPAAPAAALPVAHVVLASLVPAAAGTGLLAALNRFMLKASRPFAGVASVFAILSIGGPLSLAGADGATKLVLALMHLATAAAIAGSLLRGGKAPS